MSVRVTRAWRWLVLGFAVVGVVGGVMTAAYQSGDSLRPAANKAEAQAQVWALRQRISGPAAFSLSVLLKSAQEQAFDLADARVEIKDSPTQAEGVRLAMRNVKRRIDTQELVGFTACDEAKSLRADQTLRLADFTTRVPQLAAELTRGEAISCDSGTAADLQAQTEKAANALNAAVAARGQLSAAASKLEELRSHKVDVEDELRWDGPKRLAQIIKSGTTVSSALKQYESMRGRVDTDLDFLRRTYGVGAPFDLSADIFSATSDLIIVEGAFSARRFPSRADIDAVVAETRRLEPEMSSLARDATTLRTRAAPHYECSFASIDPGPNLKQLAADLEGSKARLTALTTRAQDCARRYSTAPVSPPAPASVRTLVRLAFPQPSVTIKVGGTFTRPDLYAYYSDAPDTPVTPLGAVQYSGIPLPFTPSRPMTAFLSATLDGQSAIMTVRVEPAAGTPSSPVPSAPSPNQPGANPPSPPKPAPDPTVPVPPADPPVPSPGPPPTPVVPPGPPPPPRGEFDWAGTWVLTAGNARDSGVLTLARLDAAGGMQELQKAYAGSLPNICRSSGGPMRVYTGRLTFGGGDVYHAVACSGGSDLDGRLGIEKDSQPKGQFTFTEGSPAGSWGPMTQLWSTQEWRIRKK